MSRKQMIKRRIGLKESAGSLSDLRANERNPRVITPEAMERLEKALKEFGDLGGIVKNIRTGNMVGGHQRVAAFQKLENAQIIIGERMRKPDRCGTVAFGFVHLHGTRYTYREVDWPDHKEMAAMLAANQHGGEFDWSSVSKILQELKGEIDIDLTGFDSEKMESLLMKFSAPGEFPEVDKNLEIEHVCPKCGYQWSGKLK